MTTLEAEHAKSALLLVPLGATEQHGPHLPMATDSTIAGAWCDRLASQLDDAVVAPTLAFGSSGEHQSFAGTLSIGQDALVSVLVELTRSAAHTFAGVLFVSGHAGNADPLARAVDQLHGEGHIVAAVLPVLAGADAHAGETETSIMLALAPDVVRIERAAPGCTDRLVDIVDDMRAGGVSAVSANGVLGDPTLATASNGERLLAELGEKASAINSWFARATSR